MHVLSLEDSNQAEPTKPYNAHVIATHEQEKYNVKFGLSEGKLADIH